MSSKQIKSSITPEKSNWRIWFICVTVLSCLFVLSCSYILHDRSRQEAVKIEKKYRQANSHIKKTIAELKPDTLSSPYTINNEVLQQMQHNEQMIKDLLEVEFNRIQTERNVLEIWAAVITIVFLVFSFYSTFRTDDMVKDAKSLLESLNIMHTKAVGEKSAIEGELRGILTPYATQATTLADNVKKMESELGKISDLPNRLKKIDGLDQFIAESVKKLEDIQSSIKKHESEIQNLREDVDELSQSEPDEEEL